MAGWLTHGHRDSIAFEPDTALRDHVGHRPKMLLPSVGSQPDVDLRHDTVSKIRNAVNAGLMPPNEG